ncbi:hypothetical protein BJV77DRAFT_942190 [Russula vinacea]|nr:hypothetical protein BJV77DRAFT_942190 [Russula vinacea]
MSIPALPPVQSDAALTIFIHSSLKTTAQNDRFGDSDRLAFTGKQVLGMAIAETLFEKRPMLSAVDLESGLSEALSNESYDQWVSQYGMREKVACPANLREELKEPKETEHLFNAYVGALYVERGYPAVKAWIQPLIDPDFTPSSTSFGGANPPPPASPPPPLPGNSLGPGVFLASFNQMAAQRGLQVTWNASQSGPGHALVWKVDCMIGGIPKGTGAGKSKQAAKEEAARQARDAMGWNTGASGPYHCALPQRVR